MFRDSVDSIAMCFRWNIGAQLRYPAIKQRATLLAKTLIDD